MFEFIRTYQLNLMLLLCGACSVIALLLLMTRFLERKKKWALFMMEIVAFFLLWFDRLAYVYSSDVSSKGYTMVKLSNCMVFLLTSAVVFCFNIYLKYLLPLESTGRKSITRINLVTGISAAGMVFAVIFSYTGIYFYVDEYSRYNRGSGFLLAYIIPILCPLIQYTVIRQYKKSFSRLIYISLVLYIFVPIACGILQIFTYGISIVNMAMVAVSISLYIFTYLDINDTVEHAHFIEIQNMQGERQRMQRLFDQTAKAFVSAVEKKDDFTKGNSLRIAEYAMKVAQMSGMDEEECRHVYYAALLHDVGLIGIPDSVIKNEKEPSDEETEVFRRKPVIGKEILSNITEYPFLSTGAYYSHERYNGKGYPEGLKGEDIPEIARIIAVADAYVTMTSKKRYRREKPDFVAREAFVVGADDDFDPKFAGLMVKIIDEESRGKSHDDISVVEKELTCKTYRDNISLGIPIGTNITKIRFRCSPLTGLSEGFSAPSLILFDAYDRRVHRNEKAIEAYHYQEYGELWFDDHYILTSARKIRETKRSPSLKYGKLSENEYEVIAAKYDDHVKLLVRSCGYEKEDIIALMDGSTSFYIGITGENCRITDITIEQTENEVDENCIPRISGEISYIDHLESDVRNIQINQTRSATTEGMELTDSLSIRLHTMSLPVAGFIWHCPYVLLFSSDNGMVDGENYREYALIKMNGENEIKDDYAENTLTIVKKEDFSGWDAWKARNKEGTECEVEIERKGNRIVTRTENCGVCVENTTVIKDSPDRIYVALTGDRCALTDIRVR